MEEIPATSETGNYITKILEEKGTFYMSAFSLASMLVALQISPPQGEEELNSALNLAKECMKGVLSLICKECDVDPDKVFNDLEMSNRLMREEISLKDDPK